MSTDQRIFTRIPFARKLTWRDTDGNEGSAEISNVGRGGIGLVMNSYLRPGPTISVIFDDVESEGIPVELQALVSWSKPGANSGSFLCGLSWVQGERGTLPRINEVYYAAINDHVASGAA